MILHSQVSWLWKARWDRMYLQRLISINMKPEIRILVHKSDLKNHLILGLFKYKIQNKKFKMRNQKKVFIKWMPISEQEVIKKLQ